LATLVDVYERKVFPIEALGPVEAIKVRCAQLGWSRRHLEPFIGSRARVSEVLSGRRALTLPMIRRINEGLGIPAEILIAEKRNKRPAAPRRGTQTRNQRATRQRATQQGVAPDGAAKRSG
jgi:HTH-type transcriptional regulator/antitoxin HigA